MTKARSEFKRVKNGEGTRYVKALENGGEVHRNSPTDFTAYDAAGHYLGLFGDQDKAEAAANSGRIGVVTVDDAQDLSLWVAWNDAVDSGARVMVDVSGRQIISFKGEMFVRAKEDDRGWEVELLTDAEMGDEYWDEATSTYELRVMGQGKFRLE